MLVCDTCNKVIAFGSLVLYTPHDGCSYCSDECCKYRYVSRKRRRIN